MQIKISVLVASYKRNGLLRWNLDSLTSCNREDTEIIVLDESFEPDLECSALAEKHGARYIHTGQNKKSEGEWRIPGFAFNIGARAANGHTLILSCAECYHPEATLDQMAEAADYESVLVPSYIYDDKGGVISVLNQGAIPSMDRISKLKRLDVTLPFFLGVSKTRFCGIGGYDEDFTGVCFDDNDLTDRLIQSGGSYVTVESPVVHLFHKRHNYRSEEIKRRWKFNRNLYEERKGKLVRNEGREWGKLK